MPDRMVRQFNVPRTYRDEVLKWNGWGYTDSYFEINKKKEVTMTGKRYDMGGQTMPELRPWFEKNLGIDITYRTPSQEKHELAIPDAIINEAFIDALHNCSISYSTAPQHRLIRGHGHTVHDLMHLRHGTFKRIPDIVVWPKNENDVEKVVNAANEFNVPVIPIGGGTSVSGALECPENETRSICSLDMALMNNIIWAGIIGIELEKELNKRGFTCGHEPDSIEFSTLGGWISTRASGMKKNRYGNIEDLLIHVNFVTTKGIIQKQCQVPRISCGPDIHHVVLGSEGTMGVVTEATIKIFPLPQVKKYGSIVFPNFENGVSFFREVARQRCQPASLRLVDNEQFRMGQALKLQSHSIWESFKGSLTKTYLTKWKGFKVDEIVAATCVFEGGEEEVENQEKALYALAIKHNGIIGGAENGRYGYQLTFAIAYLRDLSMEYGVLGESFETSVPWDKVLSLCSNVKMLIKRESVRLGVKYPVLASCRVTQVYDSGACVYFYFGFNSRGCAYPLDVYDTIESAARNEIIACGGSISHHHGIGKLRKAWIDTTIDNTSIELLQAIKENLDPKNIFASGNIITMPKSKL